MSPLTDSGNSNVLDLCIKVLQEPKWIECPGTQPGTLPGTKKEEFMTVRAAKIRKYCEEINGHLLANAEELAYGFGLVLMQYLAKDEDPRVRKAAIEQIGMGLKGHLPSWINIERIAIDAIDPV
jgi:hypothetical protein